MKSRIRQFLTPGWVLTAVVCVAFAYLAFTVLAPWQLGKNEATQERNDQLRHAFEVDPVDASELFPDQGELAEGTEWRRVTMTGEYLPDSDVLLRNRPVDGTPATHALTAFRADDGTLYLVNRGFETPADGGIPAMDAAPSGEVEILGYARRSEIVPENPPLEGGPDEPTQVYGINVDQVGDIMGLDLHQDYVQLADDQPGALRAIPLPALESGPYLAYGIQWIFFGLMAPAALAWFIFAEARERRRDREEQEALLHSSLDDAAAPAPVVPAASDADADATGETTAERVTSDGALADRVFVDDGAADAPVAVDTRPEPAAEPSTVGERSVNEADEAAAELRARRLAARYGDSGHRGRRRKGHGLDGERF
ncbi:SURF1 family protein [uncultured Corynebacterium sp.]|uniref:SURF1 family cytochrome oxidase biogenesis protein n=1 Tax=uncultured Corynebacterium sp. TaxID=159447 RepID=UPI0025E55027|nr:SURF1 family cytochrome oxidase biogenesis protein [uncultured Corynebacterium sp.]